MDGMRFPLCAGATRGQEGHPGWHQHRDAPRSCPLPGASSRREFPPSQVQTPLAGELPSCLGRGNGNHRGKKHTTRRSMEGGFGEGFGVGATPAKPSLFPGDGWPWLEMPSEEMGLRGARLGWGGRTVLAKSEFERLDLSPNPATLILIFRWNVAKSVYFPFLHLNMSLFLSVVSFFHVFPSFLPED